MANQDVSGSFDHLERLVGRLGEGRAGRHAGEVRIRDELRHPVGDSVVGSHFHHEDGEVWVILSRERIERFVQPCPVPTGHDYCDHCGRGLFRAHTKINSVAGPPGPLRVLSSNG